MSQKDKKPKVSELGSAKRREEFAEGLWQAPEASEEDWDSRRVEVDGDSTARPKGESQKLINIPVGYKVLFVLGVMLLGAWGAMKLIDGEQATKERLKALALASERENLETEKALGFLERLETAVRSYLTATSLAEKSNYVRQVDRVAPLMKEYYQEHEMEDLPYLRVDKFASLGLDKRAFMLVQVELEEEVEEDKMILLVVEETEDDQILIDWESDVAYQPVDLADYIANKPEDPVDLRLYVSEDNFYNFEFSDPERYLSLKLSDRDTDAYFFGYVELESEAHREIESLLKKSETGIEPALLRVRFLPGTRSKRSVLIEKVVEPRWIHVDDPSEKDS